MSLSGNQYSLTRVASINRPRDEKQFPNKEAALKAAEKYVGNNRYNKMFPNENSYIFGPGDGTTSCMVRQDIEF